MCVCFDVLLPLEKNNNLIQNEYLKKNENIFNCFRQLFIKPFLKLLSETEVSICLKRLFISVEITIDINDSIKPIHNRV